MLRKSMRVPAVAAVLAASVPAFAGLTAILATSKSAFAESQVSQADSESESSTPMASMPRSGEMTRRGQHMMDGRMAEPGTRTPAMMQDQMMEMPMGGRRATMIKVIFAIADADGDGSLSFDEISSIHKRIFDVMDADGDGKLTLEELQAFTGHNP